MVWGGAHGFAFLSNQLSGGILLEGYSLRLIRIIGLKLYMFYKAQSLWRSRARVFRKSKYNTTECKCLGELRGLHQ